MIIKPPEFKPSSKLTEADVTPESIYLERRQFMQQGLYGLAAMAFAGFSSSLSAKNLAFKTNHVWR